RRVPGHVCSGQSGTDKEKAPLNVNQVRPISMHQQHQVSLLPAARQGIGGQYAAKKWGYLCDRYLHHVVDFYVDNAQFAL
ncbi:hypothetical protein, partial [Chimaeribacter arupi]|uniref:hypothetical protein n=1 Tax=Chimaeribacter arupi TaxID=2060066 RepID=UPI001F4EE0B0